MIRRPYDIIKIDKYTHKIPLPSLILMTRSEDIIGKISRYENWNMSLVGNGVDEISFTVAKYVNGILCPVWDSLIDLKIVEVKDFGRFEISVNYTDETKTVKSIIGKSLEAELGQIALYEFHVNDEDAMTMEITDYNTNDFDGHGNFIPTVFYDETDPKHSLLDRVLADKAPHWHIGYVTPYIALSEDEQPESASIFQRTYTCNGTNIYDFLTGDVAQESNVIFIFDTIHREINCYSLCDCIDQETGEILEHGIGEDTIVLVSKQKLANEITISSNVDGVKNCFRIEGGDDIITDMVRVANINGTNYIYQFADFQYNDMPKKLVDKIKKYNEDISKETEVYYGENGIFTRLCEKYDDLLYYESSMMPEVNITDTTAEEQYNIMLNSLKSMTVGVSSVNNYNDNLFVGVSNNVEAMANILIDSRYNAKIIEDSTSYNSSTHTWTGNIQITRTTDNTDYYPKSNADIIATFSVNISDDELTFNRQKIEKALSKGSMLDIDFDVANMSEEKMREYFEQYSLNRLKSFYDGYNSCLSVLMSLNAESDTYKDLYDKYHTRMTIISNPPTDEHPTPTPGVLDIRQSQVDSINAEINTLLKEQAEFQDRWNFQKYLDHDGDDLYKVFCSYRREDVYTNSNYISDGLSTAECIAKAKELIDAATEEAKKACVLQRTVSTNLNNLFALPEFKPLWDKFALFNYIRIRTEDEILKLRLIGVEFSGDSVSEINVTFSEQVESVDGKMSDLESILQQADSMSTSYSSTALQAKKGAQAKDIFNDIYNNGLNAAKTMLSNNDNNEVTVTSSGIIGKRMDDEGFYGEKQFRITGNIFVFTKNNWRTVELAIGETTFYNPLTQRNEKKYGILAPAIVGRMILGENLGIYSKGNELTFDANGLRVTNDTNTFSVNPSSETLLSLENKNGKTFWVDESGELHIKADGSALDISANSTIEGLSSRIDANEKEIKLKVSDGEISSKLSLESGKITLSSDRLVVDSKNFKLDENGNVSLSGNITGSSGEFTDGFFVNIDYGVHSGAWIMSAYEGEIIIGLERGNSSDSQFPYSNITFSTDGIVLKSKKNIEICSDWGDISLFAYSKTGGYNNMTLAGNLIVTENTSLYKDVTIEGALIVEGSKNRLIKTKNYDKRLLYCYETTSPFFGDIGHGIIGNDGLCYVYIDSIFSETIDVLHEYYVFIQSYSGSTPYIYQKEPCYFVIKGEPNTEFDWEIKAKQADYTLERLDTYATKENNYAEFNYVQDTEEYLTNYEKELVVNE